MTTSVIMTKERWAAVIRLMMEGQDEGYYYVGRDEEDESLISDVCSQSGITTAEAQAMEPVRNIYVPKG